MTVDKQHGRFVFECDECTSTFEAPTTDAFFDALARIKEEGWIVTRNEDDTEWVHTCDACVMHPTKPMRRMPVRPISQRKK